MCCCEDMTLRGDDDVWGEEQEDHAVGGPGELHREWQARREEHYNSGYREGLEAGKHEAVQEGFNQGKCSRQGVCGGLAQAWCRSFLVADRNYAPIGGLQGTARALRRGLRWVRPAAPPPPPEVLPFSASRRLSSSSRCSNRRHHCSSV